ncbi:hypothetical protein HanPSC8_Chr02g0062671 [Helianthus annuus]|nr:hypothetical protein HanPSC8_Chr02g0062671 [Helianthus annuus]
MHLPSGLEKPPQHTRKASLSEILAAGCYYIHMNRLLVLLLIQNPHHQQALFQVLEALTSSCLHHNSILLQHLPHLTTSILQIPHSNCHSTRTASRFHTVTPI